MTIDKGIGTYAGHGRMAGLLFKGWISNVYWGMPVLYMN